MASCGSMLSVILCHCTRSSHFQAKHSCCHTCHCCEASDGEGFRLPSSCGCTHDHSTEIDLYNHEKSQPSLLAPAVCAILPQLQEQISPCDGISTIKLFDRRKTPLPTSDFVALKGLRAPPVIA